MAQGRGALTERVQDKAKELLGREITLRELRLMPYVASIVQNAQFVDQRHVNDEERVILQQWDIDEWVHNSPARFTCTKEFWDIMNEIIWLSYVDLS